MKSFSLVELIIAIIIGSIISIAGISIISSMSQNQHMLNMIEKQTSSNANAILLLSNLLEYMIIKDGINLGEIKFYSINREFLYGYKTIDSIVPASSDTLLPSHPLLASKNNLNLDFNATHSFQANEMIYIKGLNTADIYKIKNVSPNTISLESNMDKIDSKVSVLKLDPQRELKLRDNNLILDDVVLFKNVKNATLHIQNIKNARLLTLEICQSKCFQISGINTF